MEQPPTPSPTTAVFITSNQKALKEDLGPLLSKNHDLADPFFAVFESASPSLRPLLLSGLLARCQSTELSHIARTLQPLLRIDPIARLSPKIGRSIFRHLDATSLGRCARVSKQWKELADSDQVWWYLCAQHINRRCTGCGLGLPLLDKGRISKKRRADAHLPPADVPYSQASSNKRPCTDIPHQAPTSLQPFDGRTTSVPSLYTEPPPRRRPWKEVFTERLLIESNWRHGRYATHRIENAHPEGVLCLQFEDRSNTLISAGYDCMVRIWDMESGRMLNTLPGHTKAVRALRFDDAKLVTAGDDRTIRVWDWRGGRCTRVLQTHAAVLALDVDDFVMASGGADGTVRVWDFQTGECSTLQQVEEPPIVNNRIDDNLENETGNNCQGKGVNCIALWRRTRLFAGGEDGIVRLWCLPTRSCVRIFQGHAGQVTGLSLSLASWVSSLAKVRTLGQTNNNPSAYVNTPHPPNPDVADSQAVLCTSSLDGTLKLFAVAPTSDAPTTSECLKTLFGHAAGVWSVASDSLRIASGAHDGEVRIWDAAEGRTLVAVPKCHVGAVFVAALGDTKVVTGGADGDISILDFGKVSKRPTI